MSSIKDQLHTIYHNVRLVHRYLRECYGPIFFFFYVSISYLVKYCQQQDNERGPLFSSSALHTCVQSIPTARVKSQHFFPVCNIFFFRRFSFFSPHFLLHTLSFCFCFYIQHPLKCITKRPSVPSGRALERSRSCQTKHSLVWQPLASLTWYRATAATSVYLG
ncbi:hypothetical protein HDV63DRAFT_18160 [Trichoderma sp. SZMC 28014]